MKHKLYFWIEEYLFNPNLLQKVVSLLLLPLTGLYCLVIFIKKLRSKPKDFGIKIISIGNLIVGGSGKTPITIALASTKKDVAVVLRGYGRDSKGLKVISENGNIKTDVNVSGDEAMLLAKSLKDATIIVSEDRKEGILKAKELGSKIVFLDDGHSKYDIKKFDILIKPNLPYINSFCLPSGPYRESKASYRYSDLTLVEDIDFKRVTTIKDPTDKMVLVTAISKPQRLDKFVSSEIPRVYFPDHYNFKKSELEELLVKYEATSILTTTKDLVKIEKFNLPLSILELKIDFRVPFTKSLPL
jgi:tetraacyldisaccharide 4'-kinase